VRSKIWTSSARVMTTCAMMGQAAGVAAAWAVDEAVAVGEIDGERLSREMVARGAVL